MSAVLTGQKCREETKVSGCSSPVREIDVMAHGGIMVFRGYFKVFRPAQSESMRTELLRNKVAGA